MTTKILSIDGGGLRGYIPAALAAEIERRMGKGVSDVFDMISGTSTGGILAGCLAVAGSDGKAMYSAESLARLYVEDGSTIFKRSAFHALSSAWGLMGPKYDGKGLRSVMERYLRQARLSACRTRVLITSYDITTCKPFFFKSWEAKEDPDLDFDMVDVVCATASAPTFFPPTLISRSSGDLVLIDGGMVANDPALCAYVDALDHKTDDVMIVSLGTGSSTRPLAYDKVDTWGVARWAKALLQIFENSGDVVDYQLSSVLDSKSYFRFQTKEQAAMDDVSAIPGLQQAAANLIASSSKAIDEVCERLTR
jgi:uncharacterized protein